MRLLSPLLLLFLLALSLVQVVPALAAPPAPVRQTQPFGTDWKFLKADAPGAEQPAFADASWRTVTLPHDWAIEGPFDQNAPEGGAGAFLNTGIGWYRKHFTLPQADKGKRVFIDFDGVMQNSDVYINGFLLGHRPYGYVAFQYELTGHLNFGADAPNVLAVRADNSQQPDSRWYAGAGIYRPVHLVITDPVHLGHWATFVTTPAVSAQLATVHVQSSVVNQGSAASSVSLQITLLAPGGKTVATASTPAQTVAAGSTADFGQDLTVHAPKLWNLDSPSLYHLVTRVQSQGSTLDDETTPFGIREFHFDAATGFWLNGKNFKIKGAALHGDMGGLGVAVPRSAWVKRLSALKSLGVNAIRTAHDPPSSDFLDVCDQLGLLVMDEMFDCWTVAKNPYDYHLYFNAWSVRDTQDTVLRDRNHPSIILYSAGNEIHDTPDAELSKAILGKLLAAFHGADPTRPVTQALFRPNVSHDYEDGLADMLDVVGQNYRENEILAAHAQNPNRKIIGTENTHTLAVWLALRDNPPYAGQFLWTGADYLGESSRWPVIAGASGLLDRTDAPRARGYQRQSWWSDMPAVHITRTQIVPDVVGGGDAALRVPPQSMDWTPLNTTPHMENVEVYSNCAQVELFLNGTSLGAKPKPADDAPRRWQVTYAPGILRAVGTANGKTVATDELRTAGPAAKIVLTTDGTKLPNDWDDVTYVTASVVDANGILVPGAQDLISFSTKGPGTVVATDNGDVSNHDAFQAPQHHVYHGTCIAVLRASAASGAITLTASAPGLTSGSVTIQATKPQPAP